MAVYELNASLREDFGKGAARKIRRSGGVPCVVYGRGLKAMSITLDQEEFEHFLAHHNASTALIKLKIDGRKELADQWLMIRELHLHHIEGYPISVGFMAVDKDRIVTCSVPLVFEGEAVGVGMGGSLQPLTREVRIRCLPDQIPPTIHWDMTKIESGETWYAKDLKLPEGISLALSPETPLITCETPRKEEEEEEEKTEEAAEEGEAEEASSSPDNS